MFGDAMSIFARSTCAPSGNSPARIRANRSRFSSTGAVAVRAVRARLGQRAAVLRGSPRRSGCRRRPCPCSISCTAQLVELLEVVGGVDAARRSSRSPSQRTSSWIASTYSTSSFVGLVSSKRRLQVPPNSRGDAEVQADRLGVADVQVAIRLGREARGDAPAVLPRLHVVRDDGADEVERRLRVSHRACHSRVGTHEETLIIRADRW